MKPGPLHFGCLLAIAAAAALWALIGSAAIKASETLERIAHRG